MRPFSILIVLLPLGVAACLALPLARVLRGPGWIDLPRPDRHRADRDHSAAVSRAGGTAWLLAMFAGLAVAAIAAGRTPGLDPAPGLDPRAVLAVLLLLAFGLGRADDAGRVGPAAKWALQSALLVAGAVFLRFPSREAGAPLFPLAPALALLAALFLQTALEIFDNLDGALGIAASAGFFALAATAGPAWAREAALAGAGASLGFLLWNRPPARIFLGNSGSHAVALLAALLLFLVLSGEPAGGAVPARWAVLLGFAWPCADLAYVTVARLRRGVPPWRGGRDHTTHRLARALGSDRAAGAFILAVSGAGLGLTLLLFRGGFLMPGPR